MYISFSDLVLEETQIGDPLPPKVHVYLLTLAYIYIYIMQPDSEQVVQEEHPIKVAISEAPVLEEHQTGRPLFTHQQVCLCRSLSLYISVHISRSSNIQYVS